MATKNEILAQLYAIKAGLSIISQEKDKIAKQESILQSIDNDLAKARAELSVHNDSEQRTKKEIANLQERLKNPNVSHIKISYTAPKSTWWIFVIGFILGMVLPIAIGAAIGGEEWFDNMLSVALAWAGGFAGLFVAGPINKKVQKKAEDEALAKAEAEYQKKLEREKQHQAKQITTQIENFNKGLAIQKQKQEALQNTIATLSEKFNQQLEIYNTQKDISLSLVKTVYDALIAEYSSLLDPRDWKNIDFIIFYYETGRVDTIKEALIHVDKQRQTDTIAKAIKQASVEISSTINTSMATLRSDLNSCFGALSTQLDKSMQIQLQALQQSNSAIGALSSSVGELGGQLQSALTNLGNEQALTNALLDKVATSSDTLVDDLNYVMGYKAPYYLKK